MEIVELGILIIGGLIHIALIFIFVLVPLLLYFYNLLNPTGIILKNTALRMVVIGLIPTCTPFLFMPAYNLFLIGVICLIVVILILSLFLSYFFSAHYFRHLFLIYLYYLTMFSFYLLTRYTNYFPPYDVLLSFIVWVISFIALSLLLYWFVGLLLFQKSYFNRHDRVCILWCFGVIVIASLEDPILKLLIYKPLSLVFNLDGLWILFFFVPPFTIYGLILFFYYSRYFLKLYQNKKLKK
ncbi:hypothetical protein BBW65_05710 [Helicobacter enhydrae]|uniref:Uncharacterized protein n=1 Tax=Helicobacter enhydrae TaxID=222136 RepID=A0A1B1U6L1_9HELI|nr:hypothetical protein BBW65_05710 [Helicobacter enhydrae]